jgi:hypothetical protein
MVKFPRIALARATIFDVARMSLGISGQWGNVAGITSWPSMT